MPVIGGTNFEQTHTEQISAQLEIMGHLEIHMNETICSPSPLPIYDQMVSTSTRSVSQFKSLLDYKIHPIGYLSKRFPIG
jgi:hypothetical protein